MLRTSIERLIFSHKYKWLIICEKKERWGRKEDKRKVEGREGKGRREEGNIILFLEYL